MGLTKLKGTGGKCTSHLNNEQFFYLYLASAGASLGSVPKHRRILCANEAGAAAAGAAAPLPAPQRGPAPLQGSPGAAGRGCRPQQQRMYRMSAPRLEKPQQPCELSLRSRRGTHTLRLCSCQGRARLRCPGEPCATSRGPASTKRPSLCASAGGTAAASNAGENKPFNS